MEYVNQTTARRSREPGMGAITDAPKAPRPPSEISDALGLQAESNQVLHQAIDKLLNVLDPILSPDVIPPGDAEKEPSQCCQLGSTMSRYAKDTQYAAQRLGRLLDRINL